MSDLRYDAAGWDLPGGPPQRGDLLLERPIVDLAGRCLQVAASLATALALVIGAMHAHAAAPERAPAASSPSAADAASRPASPGE